MKSQKNEVTTVSSDGTKAIRKCYKNPQSMATEIATINLLQRHGVRVASVLLTKDNVAILERIDGITYLDILERIEQNLLEDRSIDRTAKELCLWLEDYYTATGNASRGDVNFRNFIFTSFGKCVGIDFEEPLDFKPREYDMGRILAYAATYEPMFSLGKLKLCKAFLGYFLKMDGDIDDIHKQYDIEIDSMAKRRAGFLEDVEKAKDFWSLVVK